MTSQVNRLVDWVLERFLPRVDAGACVPEHGDLEWILGCGSCGCTSSSQSRFIRKDCRCRINCTGSDCVPTGETRCITTQQLC